jgi:hypothetical protein
MFEIVFHVSLVLDYRFRCLICLFTESDRSFPI